MCNLLLTLIQMQSSDHDSLSAVTEISERYDGMAFDTQMFWKQQARLFNGYLGLNVDVELLAADVRSVLFDHIGSAFEDKVSAMEANVPAADLNREHRIGAHEAGVRTGRAA